MYEQAEAGQAVVVKQVKDFSYHESDAIGSGASSTVYRGQNVYTHEAVAIKVINLDKVVNPVEKYLLGNELNALASLAHRNVLRQHQTFRSLRNVYIITEFCDQGNLQSLIRKNHHIQEQEALRILKEIVQGYVEIEAKNILHRDLKSANIFISNTGIKIGDFGYCQIVTHRKPEQKYNVGSPAYMSQQAHDKCLYSSKSDIWSIGIILYEMIHGQTPYKTSSYSEMISKLVQGKYVVQDRTREILSVCFKQNPVQRATPIQLLHLINKCLDQNTSKYQIQQKVQFVSDVNKVKSNDFRDIKQVYLIGFLKRMLKYALSASFQPILPLAILLYRHGVYINGNSYLIRNTQSQQFQTLNNVVKDLQDFFRSNFVLSNAEKQVLQTPLGKTLTESSAFLLDTLGDYGRHLEVSKQVSAVDAILWDYLMLQYQILLLSKNDFSVAKIVEITNLQLILSQKPKLLTPSHSQLLNFRFKCLLEASLQ